MAHCLPARVIFMWLTPSSLFNPFLVWLFSPFSVTTWKSWISHGTKHRQMTKKGAYPWLDLVFYTSADQRAALIPTLLKIFDLVLLVDSTPSAEAFRVQNYTWYSFVLKMKSVIKTMEVWVGPSKNQLSFSSSENEDCIETLHIVHLWTWDR